MDKINLKYPASKIDELLIKIDSQNFNNYLLNTGGILKGRYYLGLNAEISNNSGGRILGHDGLSTTIIGNAGGILNLEAVGLNVRVSNGLSSYRVLTEADRGINIVPLDSYGKISSQYLPSSVDDIIEVDSTNDLKTTTGERGKIYVTLDTNITYRWSGTQFVEISKSLGLGTNENEAYPGNLGAQNARNIASLTSTVGTHSTDISNLKNTVGGHTNSLSTITNTLQTVNQSIINQGTTISDHTEQIANLDSNKLGKTEKASDSAKADALTVNGITSDTNYGTTAGIIQNTADNPTGYWWNKFRILHNNSAGYFTELAMPFVAASGLYYRSKNGGEVSEWHKIPFASEIPSLSLQGKTGAMLYPEPNALTAGWYRIGVTTRTSQQGWTFRMMLRRGFNYDAGETYIIDVAIGYGGTNNVYFTQVAGGIYNSRLIDKVRVTVASNSKSYIDLHIATDCKNNIAYIFVGDAEAYASGTIVTEETATTYEFSTVNGLSSSHNITAPKFIGALQGNADSASKLANTRKLWGQNFDGTGDVNGNLILYNADDLDNGNASSSKLVFGGSAAWRGPYIEGVAGGGWGMKNLVFYQYNTQEWPGDYSKHYAAMTLDVQGRLGIGTTTPTEKLEVNGNVKATKFIGALQGNADSASMSYGLKTFLPANADANHNTFYIGGQYAVSTTEEEGKVFVGSSGNRKVISVPVLDGSSTTANVMNLRMSFNAAYWHDIATGPNRGDLWHRAVNKGTAREWSTILDSSNYTSYVVPATGGAFTGPVRFPGSGMVWYSATAAEGSASAFTGLSRNRHGTAFIGINASINDSHQLTLAAEHVNIGASGILFYGNEGTRKNNIRFITRPKGTAGEVFDPAVYTRIIITESGNVGIGTSNPSEKLDVVGNIKSSGNVSAINGNFSGTLSVGGNATITGTMTATATYHSSDERLKSFEEDVEVDLEKIKTLPKKYFHWTSDADGKRQLGTSAQAVEEIFPELVSTNADGYKSVNYANLSIVALAAVDKLSEQNKALEERLLKIEKLLNIE